MTASGFISDPSWFVGVVSADPRVDASEALARVFPPPVRSIASSRSIAIAAGPESSTCRVLTSSGHCLVLCGSPLSRAGGGFTFPGAKAFDGLPGIEAREIRARIGGQYAAARMHDDGVDLLTDPGGLRSIFVAPRSGAVWFSTHLRLLASAGLDLTLDPRRFGSHWLGHNQLSDRFFVQGVTRIAGSRTARIGPDGSIRFSKLAPDPPAAVDRDPMRPVEAFLESCPGPVLLGLSGGLDSRTLLAALPRRIDEGRVFTFGDESVADVRTALELATEAGMRAVRVPDASLQDVLDSGLLQEFAADMSCSVPISAVRRLANYAALHEDLARAVVVDGGFGEIGRAQLYRSVELARALPSTRSARMARFRRCLAHARADVFEPAVVAEMEAGFLEDLEEVAQILDASSLERPADELGLRFRRPNFFGLGQAWIDRFCFNTMPFAQDEFVSSVLALPAARRRGGRVFKRYIRRSAPALTGPPLVKGSLTYPFNLPAEALPLYSRLQRRPPLPREPLFGGLREYVQDLVASRPVRECALYDRQKVSVLVGDYFATGNRETALDWFLSFELWRRAVLGE